MKGRVVSFFGALILGTQIGCATWVAVRMPGPVNDEDVRVGMYRSEVERSLGVGASSQYDQGNTTTVRYEYADGPPGASKARAILYVGADIFSAFLSELIFWPIEVYANERIRRVGTAHYDDGNRLVGWTISRRDGETLHHVSSGPVSHGVSLGDDPD